MRVSACSEELCECMCLSYMYLCLCVWAFVSVLCIPVTVTIPDYYIPVTSKVTSQQKSCKPCNLVLQRGDIYPWLASPTF